MREETAPRNGACVGSTLIRAAGIAMLGLAALTLRGAPALAADSGGCGPADGAKFICGVTNVEDFAPVPGTHWLIGSNLAAAGEQGYLYVFDTKDHSVTEVKPDSIAVKPDKAKFGDCPGAPDWKLFGPHGLDLTGHGQERTLYAVNHGGRESVEVFQMDLSKGKPSFAWVGCVQAPPHFWPDAVAALPDGGMIVTSLWDPQDANRLEKLKKGEPVGELGEWHHGKGWSEVPGSHGMSGPNGVIVSKDGHEVYVALWSGREVVRIRRGEGSPKRETVKTGFLTDNLRWGPDDKLIFVGGQTAPVQTVIECFESKDTNCPKVTFQIDAMNPKTLKLTTIVKSGSYGGLGAGTGAVQIGDEIWVNTFRGDRIARLPAPPTM